MSAARVQILLATFQGAAWLPELLESISAQSYSDWTLLARDDGSNDATRSILHRAASQDRRMVIAEDDKTRRGAIGNFSWLLEQACPAKADYVLLADQDDIWRPEKIARQVQALQEAEAAAGRGIPQLVYCDATVVDTARRQVHASFLRQNRLPYNRANPLKTLLGRSFVLGCACAVNRALMELALPLPEVVASHDWWLALCAASAGQITRLDVPLLEYRRHSGNTSQPAIWNLLGGSGCGWRQRWQIGWQSFLRSLEQARALRQRLLERNIATGDQFNMLDLFCRVIGDPIRWRRVRGLHRLGIPAVDWPRRLLYDWCILRLK